jgi:hypothetical protein
MFSEPASKVLNSTRYLQGAQAVQTDKAAYDDHTHKCRTG